LAATARVAASSVLRARHIRFTTRRLAGSLYTGARKLATQYSGYQLPGGIPLAWETLDLPPGAVRPARSGPRESGIQIGIPVTGLQFQLETTPQLVMASVSNAHQELNPWRYVQIENENSAAGNGRYQAINQVM